MTRSKPRNTEIHESTNPGTLLGPSQNPDGWCIVSVKQIIVTILHNGQVQFSRSVVSDSLWPHGMQHSRPPCPSPTPRVYTYSRPLSQWCHPTISSSVILFSSCLKLSQHQGVFKLVNFCIRWPKYWTFSISPSNEYSGLISFRMDCLDILAIQGTLKSPRDSQESSPTSQFKSINSSVLSFLQVQLSHPYMTTGKSIALTRQIFVSKVMPLLFNMLSRLVITFLPRSKRLLISWLQSPSAVILEPKK